MDMRAYAYSAALAVATAGAVLAQSGTATVSGRVSDRSTGKAIVGARVYLQLDSRFATSDSIGRYELTGVPAGISRLTVVAESFISANFALDLGTALQMRHDITLDSTARGRAAQDLPAVGVSAPAPVINYRMVGFERRRTSGRGQYVTEDQIVRNGAYNVADAVKNLRGVLYECGGGAGCYVRMARAPGRCLPEYIVDDQVQNDFGPTTPIRDIIGVEVYSGPTDVPAEYAGRNAGCGVIVIWTRSGPARRRP
jgi:hypothetical protein